MLRSRQLENKKDLTGMTLDDIVENLKSYDMQINEVKKDESAQEKALTLKAFDSDEDIQQDEEQVSFITKTSVSSLKEKKEQEARSTPMIIRLDVTNVAR